MTTLSAQPLLVAVGSHHGDDQAGWAVADALRAKYGSATNVRKASVPLDLIDWLDDVSTLHIVDACHGDEPVGHLYRWEWSAPGDADPAAADRCVLHGSGTHDFDVPSALTLAQRLGRLPGQTVIWGVGGEDFRPADCLSAEITARIPAIADTIGKELTDARDVSGAVAAEAD